MINMVNLMNNQKGEYLEKENVNKAEAKKPPVNISRYHDQDGLSVEQMEFGYFLIKNKKKFRNVFYTLLALIGVFTWSLFFYTFGKYFFVDMKNDQLMALELSQVKSIDHQIILNLVPLALKVNQISILSNVAGKYDFVANITNPNKNHWADMKINIQYDEGNTRTEKFSILPDETKIVIIGGVDSDSRPTNEKLVFTGIGWHYFNAKTISNYAEFNQERINFSIENKKFTPAKGSVLTEKMDINSFDFVIHNKSAYNFWQYPLNIIFYTSSGMEVAKTFVVEKFKSDEIRKVSISFPGQIGMVRDTEIVPSLNIFDESNYMDFAVDKVDTVKEVVQ